MVLHIDNPRIVAAIEHQANGLGASPQTIAEGALASHLGFHDLAAAAVGGLPDAPGQRNLPLTPLPDMAAVRRPTVSAA